MLRTKERFFNPVTNSVANPRFYSESLQKRNAYAQFTENRTFALISQKRGDQVTTILGSIVKLRWEREVQRQLAVSKAENTELSSNRLLEGLDTKRSLRLQRTHLSTHQQTTLDKQRKKEALKFASPFDRIKIARVAPFWRRQNRPESQASFGKQRNECGRIR